MAMEPIAYILESVSAVFAEKLAVICSVPNLPGIEDDNSAPLNTITPIWG